MDYQRPLMMYWSARPGTIVMTMDGADIRRGRTSMPGDLWAHGLFDRLALVDPIENDPGKYEVVFSETTRPVLEGYRGWCKQDGTVTVRDLCTIRSYLKPQIDVTVRARVDKSVSDGYVELRSRPESRTLVRVKVLDL